MSVGIGNFVHEGNPYFFAVVEGVVSRACASEQEAQGLRIALEIAFRNVAVYDGDDVSDVVDVEGMPDGWKVWDVRDQEGMLAVQRPDGSLLDVVSNLMNSLNNLRASFQDSTPLVAFVGAEVILDGAGERTIGNRLRS